MFFEKSYRRSDEKQPNRLNVWKKYDIIYNQLGGT